MVTWIGPDDPGNENSPRPFTEILAAFFGKPEGPVNEHPGPDLGAWEPHPEPEAGA